MYEHVLNQLRNAGLVIDSLEVDTKSIVRCPAEGDSNNKKSGWYRIFSVTSQTGNTNFVGSFGNWKNGAIPEKGLSIKYDDSNLSSFDKEAIKNKQREAQLVADRERRFKNQQAATRASIIWNGLNEKGHSPYLTRKKVDSFGVRFNKGKLVIPVRKKDQELVGLQFINADGSKKFLTGTAKSGAFHTLGVIFPEKPLIITEGYATAASIHRATELPVIVAFDAGNIGKVISELKKSQPKQLIIIAADNDETGLKYAHQAAKDFHATVVIPEFKQASQPHKVTDFNDLHLLEGLNAVKSIIDHHLDSLNQPSQKESTTKINPESTELNESTNSYLSTDRGVFFIDPNSEGGGKPWRICGPLKVTAYARTENGNNFGLMLNFTNLDNQNCEWFVPMRLFAAERGSRVIEGLLDLGLDIDPHRNSRNRLMDYLQRTKPSKRIRLVGKMGWHDSAYVSPLGVIGNPPERLHYYSDKKALNRSSVQGTLEDWKTNIAMYCRGNPLLMFAVSIPFSGPLLEWLGMNTIGFHMIGPSSLGKSSITTVAGSVCGGTDYFRTWNTTAAALEPTAAEHSDSVLILDEINQCDPHTIGKTVYQLGNGEGKTRATDTGTGTRIQHTWRLAWLSNGERSLKEIQDRAGVVTEAGQEMRLLHIRADLHSTQRERSKKGIYQELHGFAHGAALSEYLKKEVTKHHGQAYLAFLNYLCSACSEDKKNLTSYLHRQIEKFQLDQLTNEASGQARRAAMAFSLVGLSGELATKQGITGWAPGESLQAAKLLFDNFLKDRGGEGNAEDQAILEHICLTLQSKGESNFTRWDKQEEKRVDTHQPRSIERWGFRQVEDFDHYSEEVFYIYKHAFRKRICQGFPYRRACELLKERGALEVHAGRGYLYQAYLPGAGKKKEDVYLVKMSALSDLLPEQLLENKQQKSNKIKAS